MQNILQSTALLTWTGDGDCCLKQERQAGGWLCLNSDIVASWMQCFLCSCLFDFCKLVLEVMMIIVTCTWNSRLCEQYLNSVNSGLEMEDAAPAQDTNTYLTCQWWMRVKSIAWNCVDIDQKCKELVYMIIPNASTKKKPFPSMRHIWNLVLYM